MERKSNISKNAVRPVIGAAGSNLFLSNRREWLAATVLVLAVLVTYLRAWMAGYIWDDDLVLTANPVIVGPLGLKEIWTTSAADISPLTLTTLWVEHALWGLSPGPYHGVNVLFHAANAVLLWRVLKRLFIPGAWLGAAFWALHPVQVQSVAWISEMKNTESGFFFLLSLLFFLRWIKQETKWSWDYGLTLFFAACAMASKSSTVIMPVIIGFCAWWREGRWNWRHLTMVYPLTAMAAIASALSLWTQRLQIDAGGPRWTRALQERVVEAGDAVWFYIGQLAWPHPLVFIYPRWQVDAADPVAWLPLLGVILLAALLYTKRGSWGRPYFFAFTCFLVALAPVLGIVDNYIFRYSFVFDHFIYLASMPILALVGAGFSWLFDRLASAQPRLQTIFGAIAVLALALVSFQTVSIYHDPLTLWKDTLAKNPGCWVGHYDLALVQSQGGQADEAVGHYREAIRINPKLPDAYNGLGIALAQGGHLDEALTEFRTAADLDAGNANAHGNLGEVYLKKDALDDAIFEFKKALELNPEDAANACGMGEALLKKGSVDEAIEAFESALRIDPTRIDAQEDLAKAIALRQAASPHS